jgi:endonuclease/exonuclease/phosphatase family metal-dependent hydrolase
MLRGLQESGQFSVLTANVAGLPGIISSSKPEQNTPELGRRIGKFDIVNVQEDFNYHAMLYANNDHPYRTATSGGVPFGSGLNTLSRFPFANFGVTDRIKWSKCNNDEGADCLTPKGFTWSVFQLAEGVFVNVYNVHTDAGTKPADLVARRTNINQLIDHILATASDQPVIVFGDTNTRYTRADDNIRDLSTRTGMTDAWISYVRKGNPPAAGADALACGLETTTNDCEVVDKIFFRGNNLLNLNLLNFNTELDAFRGPDGKQLSDHVPLSSTFSWSVNPAMRQSNYVGGPWGWPFTDVNAVPLGVKPTSITVRGAARIDAVEIAIGGKTLKHGGNGGSPKTLTLNSGEYLTTAEIHTGQKDGHTRVFYVKFTTSAGRTVENGAKTSNMVVYTAPSGFQISAFHGRAQDEVDALGVVYTRL